MTEKTFFPFGSMYAPIARATEVPPSEWEKDVVQMKKLGLNLIRSWVAWDRIEPVEGNRDYSMLDQIFDIADRHDMKIMLNFGGFSSLVGIYQPEWLITSHGCKVVQTGSGQPSTDRLQRRQVCYDDPIFHRLAENLIIEVVRRYAGRASLYCWLVSSEPSANGCVCEHSLDKFRSWLKNKYQDIEQLNRTWSDEYPVAYRRWEDVEPIKVGYPCQLDWQEFSEDNIAENIGWVNNLIKAHDPQKRLTTTNPNPYQLDNRAFYEGVNLWKLAGKVDVLGISHYCLQYPHKGDKPYVSSCYLDRVRSASKTEGYWVVETQAGPVLWDLSGDSPCHFSDEEAVLRYWQMLGHGAKGIMSWLYRTRIKGKQAGEFGLVGWDGSPTSRARAVGNLSALLQANADIFLDYEHRAEIAVLTSHATMRQAMLEGYEGMESKRYNQRSWMGAYDLLWDLKLQSDFIDNDDILAGKLDRYKVLIAPFVPNLSKDVAAMIEAFVRTGGCIIADFPFGFKDDNGTLLGIAPGFGLDKIFGCSFTDAVPVLEQGAGDDAPVQSSPVKPFLFRQQLTAGPGAKIIERFASGSPGLVCNDYIRGKAYMIGTMLFADYEKSERKEIADLIDSLIQPHLSSRKLVIRSGKTGAGIKNIQLCELSRARNGNKNDEFLFYILNHNNTDVEFEAVFADGIRPVEILRPAGAGLARTTTSNDDEMRLELKAKSVLLVKARR